MVAGYTEPEPMDLSVWKRQISAEERAEWFAEGRCLYSGRFNLRAEDCMARKKAQTFEVDGAEVEELGTKEGSNETGQDHINWRRMALLLR